MSLSKLKKYPAIARIAAKEADATVQRLRSALKDYAQGKALTRGTGQLPKHDLKKRVPDLARGGAGLRKAITNRQRAGKAMAQAQSIGKKVPPIQRVVNARGNGVTFRRIGGRIVPMRKK